MLSNASTMPKTQTKTAGKNGAIKLVAGNSNQPLANAIAAHLDLPLTKASVRRFADNEIFVEIHENIRGSDVFIVQPTSYPANDHLMELLIITDAVRRSSARRIQASRRRSAPTSWPRSNHSRRRCSPASSSCR